MAACNLFNSSLNTLVKNLSDNDFNYLLEEFSDHLLELVKQKGVYPFEHMDSFNKISEDKLPDRCESFSSKKIHVSVKKIICTLPMFGIRLK